jgi:hypothetical protein
MNKQRYTRLLFIALLSGCSVLCRPDTMVKTKTVITDSDKNPNIANPMVTREVQYRQGMMRREDSLDTATTASITDIANCETRTGFVIDLYAQKAD